VRARVLPLVVLVIIALLWWLMGPRLALPGVTVVSETDVGSAPSSRAVSSYSKSKPQAAPPSSAVNARVRALMQGDGFASICGRVVSAGSKEPIAGAQIKVRQSLAGTMNLEPGQRSSLLIETDQAGCFRCNGLEEMSSIMLSVRADGYGAAYTAQLQIGNGLMKLGDIALTELKSSVRVHVTDEQGRSLQGVKVRAIQSKGDSMESQATLDPLSARGGRPVWETDHQGMVKVPLAPGFYRFEIMPMEQVPMVSEAVEVREGRESLLSVSLERGKPLRILVEDQQGRPLSGVSVRVSWRGNRWDSHRNTLENGVAAFSSVPLGTPLQIVAFSSYSSFRTFHLESHPGSTFRIVLAEARAWIRLEIESNADKGPLLVSLARLDRDGPDQESSHRFKNGVGIHMIPVAVGGDSNGVVRYRLFAQSNTSYVRSPWFVLERGKTKTCRLSIKDGSKGYLTVRVVSDANEAIQNALVQVRSRRSAEVWPIKNIPKSAAPMIAIVGGYHSGSYDLLGSLRTNSQGEALIRVLPGASLKVTVSHPDHGQVVRTVDACLPGAHRELAVVLAEKGSIHGKVYGSAKVLAGAQVFLEEEKGLLRLSTPIEGTGAYSFSGIPAGDYRLIPRTTAERSADGIQQALLLSFSQARSKLGLLLVPRATMVHVESGKSVRVDLHLRDRLGDQLRSVRFEVMGLPQVSPLVLEAFPLDQRMSGPFGGLVSQKVQLTSNGTGSLQLRKGMYFLRVRQVGKAKALMGWKRVHVLADSSSHRQIVKIWSHKSNLILRGLSTLADGIVGLRLIPEAGIGSENRRFSWTVKVASGETIRVADVPQGVYRLEAILSTGGKTFALPGTIRVHGRELVKRY